GLSQSGGRRAHGEEARDGHTGGQANGLHRPSFPLGNRRSQTEVSGGTAPPVSSLLAMSTSAPAGSSTEAASKLTRQAKRSPRPNIRAPSGDGSQVIGELSPHGAERRTRRPCRYRLNIEPGSVR